MHVERLLVLLVAGFAVGCGPSAPPKRVAEPKRAAEPRQNVDPAILSKVALNQTDISTILRDISTYVPKDQFSPSYDSSGLKDKRIDFTFSAPDGGSSADDGQPFTWYYKVDEQKLTASFNQAAFVSLKYDDDFGGVGGTRVMRTIGLGVAEASPSSNPSPRADGPPPAIEERAIVEFEKFHSQQGPSAPSYQLWTTAISPAEARIVAPKMKIHLEGKVVPGRSGELAKCVTHDWEGKTYHACYVSVQIDKLELLGLPPEAKVTKEGI
jgi:hypothetical protein